MMWPCRGTTHRSWSCLALICGSRSECNQRQIWGCFAEITLMIGFQRDMFYFFVFDISVSSLLILSPLLSGFILLLLPTYWNRLCYLPSFQFFASTVNPSFICSHHFTDSWRSWWSQGQKSFSWFLAFQSFSIISFFLKLKCYYVSNAIFANPCGSGLLYSYPFLTHLNLKVAWKNDSVADSSAKLTGFQFRPCRSSVS